MEAVESALGLNGSTSPPALHPYYPLEVEIIGYLANEWSVITLLSIFAAGIAALLGVTRIVAKKIQPSIADTELLCVMWFILSELATRRHWSIGRRLTLGLQLHLSIFSSKVRRRRRQRLGRNMLLTVADESTGYYAYNYKAMGQLQTLFGQLWKEYALSDSRYLTQDPFVLCMESITAVSLASFTHVLALCGS